MLAALSAALLFALASTAVPVHAQVTTDPGPTPGPTLSQPGPQEAPTLTLGELLALAREQSPRLQAARLQVDATRTREAGAGLLPDPMFMVGVSNLALPEFSATMPASMAPMIQATQRFPLAGQRSLRAEIARRSTEIDDAMAGEVWWTVRTEAARGFYELFRIDRQTEAMRRTLGLLGDFETVALSKYSAGTGPQADVLRAGVARARMEADIEGLVAQRRRVGYQMNGLVNRLPDTPFPTPELPPLPAALPPADTLSAWALKSRPALLGMRTAVARAESRQELARKAIWPDLTLGIQYGLGRMQGDPRSMGGASLGFSLPIYAGRRQKKLREEASALEGMAQAQLEDAVSSVRSMVGQSLAELDRARTLLHLYQEDILPQARAAVQSSLSSYRVGAVDFMSLVDAQMAVNRYEGEYFEVLASYGTALAQLEKTIGRDLPVGADLIPEIR